MSKSRQRRPRHWGAHVGSAGTTVRARWLQRERQTHFTLGQLCCGGCSRVCKSSSGKPASNMYTDICQSTRHRHLCSWCGSDGCHGSSYTHHCLWCNSDRCHGCHHAWSSRARCRIRRSPEPRMSTSGGDRQHLAALALPVRALPYAIARATHRPVLSEGPDG